jgi:hypothetical protein
MSASPLMIGKNPFHAEKKTVNGRFVKMDGEDFYEIRNYDAMSPFFMTLASDSDHWMFISSTGGLSAGRINPESALFPYYTDDKLQESSEFTGSRTILRVDGKYLWEPFSDRYAGIYKIERNIFKSIYGNKVIFEEKNLDLGLTFRYGWMNSDRFGWIKKSVLENDSSKLAEIEILDGLQNLLPYGVDRFMQNQFSTLLDGYKKAELIRESFLGLFRLESIPVDKAEPSEALKVTSVWTCGLDTPAFLLSSAQLDRFRRGGEIVEEHESKGVKGAFFVHSLVSLAAAGRQTWYFAAEVNQDAVKINNLIAWIKKNREPADEIEKSLQEGTLNLKSVVAEADGLQVSADPLVSARHFSNVLFNIMRGGIFSDGYTIERDDFLKHVSHFNKKIYQSHRNALEKLPSKIRYDELEKKVQQLHDKDMERLFLEYLPLTFSRRHGDPSRPWNLFSINIKDDNGNKLLYYQGNWRDIFQNWEALALSYPEFISGMITRFVNASTADGYNPYRVTRDGIDWEIPEPENPFSNIGYWGDHQIIYLLKLLEISGKYYPGKLQSWLAEDMFAYANVPYRIKPYAQIVKDPHDSITFDRDAHHRIEQFVKELGSDGKLVLDGSGNVLKVNLTEKILAPLLSKLSNFIPEAGIWMNTLRPEWNDANNALVGYGVSMVTLYYMRRFIHYMNDLFAASSEKSITMSEEMADFLIAVDTAFRENHGLLAQGFNDTNRRKLTDRLGSAGENFRTQVYGGFSGKRKSVPVDALLSFFSLSLEYVDQSITVNKRKDKLYHAYNLITITDTEFKIRHLYEMLEGQVSVLSSDKLTPKEVLEVLDCMRQSSLYREDQESYILYPDKRLPWFLEKNNIPAEEIKNTPLLAKLAALGDTSIITADVNGHYHFNGSFRNAGNLKSALQKLNEKGTVKVSEEDLKKALGVFEKIFDHQSFTGRSGTFYKYEGLGSIYWHMVSKLVVAIGENIEKACHNGTSLNVVARLMKHYHEAKDGLGLHKSPEKYGAFPVDPYSHTPRMAGVQQPGMTGQVKEDIISRFFELGVKVEQGEISFVPLLLQKKELIAPGNADAVDGKLPGLRFSCCGVPVIYLLRNEQGIELVMKNGEVMHFQGNTLNREISHSIFSRSGEISEIRVYIEV